MAIMAPRRRSRSPGGMGGRKSIASPRDGSPPASRTRSRIQNNQVITDIPNSQDSRTGEPALTAMTSDDHGLDQAQLSSLLDVNPNLNRRADAHRRRSSQLNSFARRGDDVLGQEKGIMSGVIYCLGEAIACGLLYREDVGYGFFPSAFIHYSVLHSTLVGALANGPMLHMFFTVVDRLVNFKSQLVNIVCKVVVDQVIWGCIWNFSYLFLMNTCTDSPGFGYIGEGLGDDVVVDLDKGIRSAFFKAIHWRIHYDLLKEGLKMLPMDIICYWLIPLQLRAAWVASVDVLWVTILSKYD